jgi:hypothetical protein
MSNFALRQLDNAMVPGEEKIYLAKRSGITLIMPYTLACIWMIAGAVGYRMLIGTHAAPLAWYAPMIGLGLAGMTYGVAMLRYKTNLLVLTNRRLLMTSQYGFRQNEIPLWGVRDVEQRKPMLGVLFHYSTFIITGGDGRHYRLSYITQPSDFYRYLSAVAFPIMQGAGTPSAAQVQTSVDSGATGGAVAAPGPQSGPFIPPGGQW